MGKFVKIRFVSIRKEVRASEVRKAVERDPAWSWLLVDKSSYLNGDVRITWVILNFGKQITVFILGLSSCVLALRFT
jgi:hypothetical protein